MSDLSPINADVKADLTHATDVTADMVKETHKGIGKVFYALLGPWIEDRIGKAKRSASQSDRDSLDILAGKKCYNAHAEKIISIENVDNVTDLCSELERVNLDCKAKRLGAAVTLASTEIKQIPEEEISEEPLNQTFFNHWREEAELIDDEELRSWWAHLLVEEVRKPKSISPRTLDIAKNLSKQEANLFIQVSKGMIGNAIVVNGDGHPLYGTYSNVLSLQDARLVASQTSSQTFEHTIQNQKSEPAVIIPFFTNKLAIVFEKDKISFQCNFLTTAGLEINNISKTPQMFEEIKKIAEELSRQNNNAVTSILPIKIISQDASGNVQYQISWLPLWTNRPPAAANGDKK